VHTPSVNIELVHLAFMKKHMFRYLLPLESHMGKNDVVVSHFEFLLQDAESNKQDSKIQL